LWVWQRIQKSSRLSHKMFACTPWCSYLLLVPWLWQWDGSSPSVSKRTFIFSYKPFHVVSSTTSNVLKCSPISMSRLVACTKFTTTKSCLHQDYYEAQLNNASWTECDIQKLLLFMSHLQM
jgi:hypothetical protein